ncbi:ThiF family protein [Nitzschia inconspicua]|uniref:ThiF family protein n=1 Tax=Nitzschia inconspicua TaxID=303405 RepID=A0A9K3KAT6_9STRA|nr:ThiF family protein [Nitzschia inconspicua]
MRDRDENRISGRNRDESRQMTFTVMLFHQAWSVAILLCFAMAMIPVGDARRFLPWSTAPLPRNFDHSEMSFVTRRIQVQSIRKLQSLASIRGGSDGQQSDSYLSEGSSQDDQNDEERYSRQVYTLGARAHALVRSSCVIVDGPLESGLLWESLKNLALSGIGKIIILTDDESDTSECQKMDKAYHDASLDDLGMTYIRGARAEIESTNAKEKSLEKLLMEFLSRLNPSLQVSSMSKRDFTERCCDMTIKGSDAGKTIFLCVDRPYDRQEVWDTLCRSCDEVATSLPFVSVETAGVYGRVFCDFGPNHEVFDADGESPLVIPIDRVEQLETEVTLETPMLSIKTVDGERHDVSKDDIIVFQRSDGSLVESNSCRVTKVLSPERIHIKVEAHTEGSSNLAEFMEQLNSEAVSFSRQKQVQTITFLPLKNAVNKFEDLLTPCDFDKSFDATRRNAVFRSFQAMNEFVKQKGCLPTEPMNHLLETNPNDDEFERHCRNFFKTCRAKFVPLQAVFGAIASQECLKAASGLYNPIQQFLLYDCDEILVSSDRKEPTVTTTHSSLSYIVGEAVERKLQNRKVFVVGSGAIGCEILKNLAAMGAGTGDSGAVIVTDMDTIEKSNLSRQLLFRDSDIGKFKSKAAQEAIQRLNPRVKMECHTSKVGDEEDPGPFDFNFWSGGIDVILNALDNIDARLFMDAQCVTNKKALVDAGTLGSKGNVQVVVPHQSESYGSSVDPPEPAIPVCTLKNFPYAISHTIQWGRDLFDGLFARRPRQANKYASILVEQDIDGFVKLLEAELGGQAALEAASEISDDLVSALDVLRAKENEQRNLAVQWAIRLAKQLFHDSITELLTEHPPDSLDDDGEKFWSGSRKMPRTLSYSTSATDSESQQDEINKNLVEFVRSAARLRYETLVGSSKANNGIFSFISQDDATKSLAMEGSWQTSKNIGNEDGQKDLAAVQSLEEQIRQELLPLQSKTVDSALPNFFPAEFEKDDDSNDHIAFITAASNLRAISYGIPPVDTMETRKIAGKIVPAMITTTAFVSALSCIELVKLCTDNMTLKRHRNAFINLALPFFAFTPPLPAEEHPGLRGEAHTMWDRITIKEGRKAAKAGGLTLKRLLKKISKKAYEEDPDAISVSNISVGPFMIYANFLHEDDSELLDKSVWDVIKDAVTVGNEFDREFSRDSESVNSLPFDAKNDYLSPFIDLTVTVEDLESGEEVELPPVRIVRALPDPKLD